MKITSGSCFRNALEIAGVDIPANLNIPDWVPIENIPSLCKKLNIQWLYGKVEVGVEPLIVLYRTREDKGHAEYVEDIGPLLNKSIIGIIRP